MNIKVNGQNVVFDNNQVSFDEIVKLANKTGNPTVSYRTTKGFFKREGTMYPGCDPVKVEPDMVFNVVHTGTA